MTTQTIPAAVPAQPAVAPAPVAGAPAAPAQPAPEQIVAVGRLSLVRRYPLRFLAYLALTVALITATSWAFSQDRITLGLVALAGAAFVAGRFLYWFLTVQNTTLVVTNRRVIVESGVFSREAAEMPLAEVNNLQVEQDVIQAFLDVGDVAIICDKASRRELLVLGLMAPQAMVGHIRAAKG